MWDTNGNENHQNRLGHDSFNLTEWDQIVSREVATGYKTSIPLRVKTHLLGIIPGSPETTPKFSVYHVYILHPKYVPQGSVFAPPLLQHVQKEGPEPLTKSYHNITDALILNYCLSSSLVMAH